MRHVVLDQWSRRESLLHRRDPRAKILALLAFLVAVATTHGSFGLCAAAYCALLAAAFLCARLPLAGAFARAAVVLPFSLAFAAVTALAGDPSRAVMLVVKSYLSAGGVLLLVSTTPLPELLRGMEKLGAPPFLVMVAQFLYRYLFVISEEAQNMRVAGASRGATLRSLAGRAARFRAAAGALAVLFARSYARAADIHRAMLARGFEGRFQLPSTRRFGWSDAAFLLAALLLVVSVRALEYHRPGPSNAAVAPEEPPLVAGAQFVGRPSGRSRASARLAWGSGAEAPRGLKPAPQKPMLVLRRPLSRLAGSPAAKQPRSTTECVAETERRTNSPTEAGRRVAASPRRRVV